MTPFKKTFSFALAIALIFSLVACSQSQVTITLDLIVTAAEAAVTTLGSTGQLPAVTVTVVEGYLGNVSTAVDFATTELGSADTSAVKASKIAQEFAQLAIPALPSGTPQAIAQVLAEVARSVTNFLATLPTLSAMDNHPILYSESFAAQTKVALGNLAKIQKHNAKLKVKIAALKR